MNLDFASTEKQALLETKNLQHRWDNLITLINMAIADNSDQPSTSDCVN
jgi:Lon protease-like protein